MEEESKTQQLNVYSESEQHLQNLQSSLWKNNQLSAQLQQKLETDHGINAEQLAQACSILPWNYNYEVPKTIDKILTCKNKSQAEGNNMENEGVMKVSLQFPEGLLLHSTLIADIISKFCKVECLILGDVTYGACCVDDLASKQLGCDFIVHYGHSCLVAIPDLAISNALYVFVEIKFDIDLFVESVDRNFMDYKDKPILLMGIIQFNSSLVRTKGMMEKQKGFKNVILPQCKPRSKGEVLGCTSPDLGHTDPGDLVIFIGDGRFHIESTMIKNPHLTFFQYNPYTSKFTEEVYDTEQMMSIRKAEVEKAKDAKLYGIILGTLGRQGSTTILQEIENLMIKNNREYFVIFLSEINPQKLLKFEEVDAWIQIACPRLSVDWGHFCEKPLLNTYEAFTCLNEIEWQPVYPMDYYSDQGGRWSNYFVKNQEAKARKEKKGLLKKNKAQVTVKYEEAS